MDAERLARVGERIGTVVFEASLAQQRGELAKAAELHGEAVTLFALLEQWGQARTQAEQAAKLYDELGQPEKARKARYAVGVLQVHGGRGGEGSLEATLAEAEAAEDHALVAKIAERLAGTALRTENYPVAGRWIERMASAAADQGDVPGVLQALRLRAFVFQIQGRPQDAWTCLSRALGIAKQTGESALVLEMRLDLGMLVAHPIAETFVDAEEAEEHGDLGQVLADAEAGGRWGMVGYVRLALGSKEAEVDRLGEALVHAEAARQAALQAVDPTVYLMACLLIAEVLEKQGDRLGALTILFTCQASLGDLLGEDAKVPVLHVIDSLEERWGDEVFQAEMVRYRAQFEG